MRWMIFGLGILALIAGLRGAALWWKASRIEVTPPLPLHDLADVEVAERSPYWIVGTIHAFAKAGDLNRRAAVWTAVATAAGAAATVLGALP